MPRLLIVEESESLCENYKGLLKDDGGFEYDIVQTYHEAKALLTRKRYEFAVVSRTLSDAPNGEIIALVNKHNISPIVYVETLDVNIFENFQSANVASYILRDCGDNVACVMSKLNDFRMNKQRSILVVHESELYGRFLKQNLKLHSFKVILTSSLEEAMQKLELHPEVELIIFDQNIDEQEQCLQFVQNVREKGLTNLGIITLADPSNSYGTSLFLNKGVDDYLISPYTRDEFYVRIYQNLKE